MRGERDPAQYLQQQPVRPRRPAEVRLVRVLPLLEAERLREHFRLVVPVALLLGQTLRRPMEPNLPVPVKQVLRAEEVELPQVLPEPVVAEVVLRVAQMEPVVVRQEARRLVLAQVLPAFLPPLQLLEVSTLSMFLQEVLALRALVVVVLPAVSMASVVPVGRSVALPQVLPEPVVAEGRACCSQVPMEQLLVLGRAPFWCGLDRFVLQAETVPRRFFASRNSTIRAPSLSCGIFISSQPFLISQFRFRTQDRHYPNLIESFKAAKTSAAFADAPHLFLKIEQYCGNQLSLPTVIHRRFELYHIVFTKARIFSFLIALEVPAPLAKLFSKLLIVVSP